MRRGAEPLPAIGSRTAVDRVIGYLSLVAFCAPFLLYWTLPLLLERLPPPVQRAILVGLLFLVVVVTVVSTVASIWRERGDGGEGAGRTHQWHGGSRPRRSDYDTVSDVPRPLPIAEPVLTSAPVVAVPDEEALLATDSGVLYAPVRPLVPATVVS